MTDAEWNEFRSSFPTFKDQIIQIHASIRRVSAEAAAIERRLAAAWFLKHPEEQPEWYTEWKERRGP